jgi:hypothetical protein
VTDLRDEEPGDLQGGATDGGGPLDALFVVRARASYPDVVDGLERMVADGTLRGATVTEIDPRDAASRDAEYWEAIVRHVVAHGTEVVVLHHFHSPALPDPRRHIRRLQALPHRPVVAITNGDAFFNGFFRPSFPTNLLQAAEAVDVVFSTSMGVTADRLVRNTGTRVALLPHGVCQARFACAPQPSEREFRVTFIGSNNRPRNPLHSYHWYARRRERLVRRLSARFGDGFALFGRGWEGIEGWRGPVPFAEQLDACRRADIVVGGVPFSPARYYHSDRIYTQVASGVPFVDLAVDGVDRLLRDGEHWHLARSIEEVVGVCEDLLSQSPGRRNELAAAAAEYVFARHTVEARCRALIGTMTQLRDAIRRGVTPEGPNLDFLLPEVDRGTERPLASRNWSEGAR